MPESRGCTCAAWAVSNAASTARGRSARRAAGDGLRVEKPSGVSRTATDDLVMNGRGAVTSADAVIIGGGIVGVSTAYFLAEAGVRNVLVLEQATVGAGASGRAAGVMLLQGDSEPQLRFQLESIQIH